MVGRDDALGRLHLRMTGSSLAMPPGTVVGVRHGADKNSKRVEYPDWLDTMLSNRAIVASV